MQDTMESNSVEDTLVNVRKKFKDTQQLLDNLEKHRTENEPYKIEYQVIEMLKVVETDLINISANVPEEKKCEVDEMLAIAHVNLGLLHASTEELKAGEEQFMKCITTLKNKELEPEGIFPILCALNQLGIIWAQWNEPAKAKVFLDQAVQIYNDFTNIGNECNASIIMVQYMSIENAKELSPKELIEKVHTLTLYYLAQVYSSLKDHCQSAIYYHMTLCRQLDHMDNMQDLNYIDWALNAATLSQYFMEINGFSQARHHLAAATYILQKYENILKQKSESDGESEALAAEWESFKHRSADVARCWAKYGILLLNSSKLRLLERSESELEDSQPDNKESFQSKLLEELKFETLEKEIEPIAIQITDKYLLDFDDARLAFLNAHKWLQQAKTYYTLENHASDYILIVQDMSQAYKYLSFFEEHEDRQAKMHKRRIDILESVIKELSPQYYKFACRQIWIELGETYSDILDIKLDRLRMTDYEGLTPTPQLTKINHLAKNSINNYQAFLDSLDMRNSNSTMEQFPDEVLQPALFSFFRLGRLYNKIITPDKAIQLENTQNSMNAYKFLVDYCEKYPNAAEIMKVKLHLCKEMVSLLPLKVKKLKEEMMN